MHELHFVRLFQSDLGSGLRLGGSRAVTRLAGGWETGLCRHHQRRTSQAKQFPRQRFGSNPDFSHLVSTSVYVVLKILNLRQYTISEFNLHKIAFKI